MRHETVAVVTFLCFAILAGRAVPARGIDASDSSKLDVYRRAESLIEAHRLSEAEALLRPLLETNPRNPRALLLEGKLRAAQGLDQESLQYLQSALAVEPSSVDTRLEIGLVQSSLGLHEDALASFEDVLDTDPANKVARVEEVKNAVALALAARQAGDQQGALVYLVRARHWVANDPDLLRDFGIQSESLRLYRDAEDALKQSLAMRPGDPDTTYALARVELDEQKMDLAERDLRAYLAQRPADATAHYGLGRLLHMLSRTEESRVELLRSVELQPAQTESCYELGQIELEMRNDGKASSWFGKALGRNPNHGGALTGMGILQYRARDYTKAESYLAQAVIYAPDYAPAHRFYGLTLVRLGKQQQADGELATAARIERDEVAGRNGLALQSAGEAATH